MSVRTEKVAAEIKKSLAETISEIAREENAGLVTLTTVRISPDLKIAKLYISIYGSQKSPIGFINTLEKKQGWLRHILGAKIRLRFTPELRFYIDDTLDEIEHIQKVLDSVIVNDSAKADDQDENSL